MTFALGIILFVVGIAISVALHEAGHMVTAKAFKMRVRRYFIGFGPTLFKKEHKGTEYGLKLLPLGGFCDIAGMTILDEELTEEEKPHAMYKKPAYQRIVVMLGGVFANILIGLVLIYSIAVGWGLPNLHSPIVTRISDTSCVADQHKDGSLASCQGAGPAALAGAQSGDIIVQVNGQKIESAEQVIALTQQSPDTVTYTVKRGSDTKDLIISTVKAKRLHEGNLHTVSVSGVSIRQEPLESLKHYNAGSAIPAALGFSWDINKLIVHALVKIPGQMPGLVKSIFGGERSADSPMSVVGASVAGGDALAFGSWSVFLMLMAQINFCLALFNLIPLPPLDGGHVAVIIYEKIRDAIRHLRGKEPLGPADYSKLMPLTSIVVFLLILLFVVTVLADVVNPIRLVR